MQIDDVERRLREVHRLREEENERNRREEEDNRRMRSQEAEL